jgi:transposase InsO family protein
MLGVSRGGFYASRYHKPSRRAKQDAALMEMICGYHKASNKTYGSPRIHADLLDDGVKVCRKRVEHLMKAAGLRGR